MAKHRERALAAIDKWLPLLSTFDSSKYPPEYIGSGATRWCLALTSTTVLKVDKTTWSGACAREACTYTSAPEAVKSLLCPVLASGRLPDGRTWLVMARAAPLHKYTYEDRDFSDGWDGPEETLREDVAPYFLTRLGEGFEDGGDGVFYVGDIGDVHAANVGELNGRWVVLDYEG
jgi:hypothetical protein